MNISEKLQAERRRYKRIKMQMSLNCVKLDPQECDVMDKLHMTDLSRSGIGAVSDRLYYPGQRVVLNMPLPDGQGNRSVYATVKRCGPDRDKGYRVGMEFDKITTGNWCGVSSNKSTPIAA